MGHEDSCRILRAAIASQPVFIAGTIQHQTMKLSATLLALAAGQVASNFVTLGDWGAPGLGANEEPRLSSVSDNLTDQQLVAEQLGKFAGAYNASFLLALGDNFYENGVNGVDDPQWNNTYTNVYTVRSYSQLLFYVLTRSISRQNLYKCRM